MRATCRTILGAEQAAKVLMMVRYRALSGCSPGSWVINLYTSSALGDNTHNDTQHSTAQHSTAQHTTRSTITIAHHNRAVEDKLPLDFWGYKISCLCPVSWETLKS